MLQQCCLVFAKFCRSSKISHFLANLLRTTRLISRGWMDFEKNDTLDCGLHISVIDSESIISENFSWLVRKLHNWKGIQSIKIVKIAFLLFFHDLLSSLDYAHTKFQSLHCAPQAFVKIFPYLRFSPHCSCLKKLRNPIWCFLIKMKMWWKALQKWLLIWHREAVMS